MKKVEGYFKFRFTPDKYTVATKLNIEVEILDEGFVEDVKILVYHADKLERKEKLEYVEKTKENSSMFRKQMMFANAGVYWYCFAFKLEGRQVYVFKNRKYLETQELNVYPDEYCWRIEVKDAKLKEYPEWRKRRIYQIIPDKFAIGSNGIIAVPGRKMKDWKDRMPDWKPDADGEYRNEYFYGGNLQGIKEKLPYIKEMGFNAIYLNPICKSRNNHHYDAEDYWQIDPMLGTWKDLEELCAEAKKLDIKVICDIAFNHTSDEHPYFKSAVSDEKSPYRNFYIFKDGKPVTWYGYSNMPELNKQNPEVIKECIEILRKYVKSGVDAFRMDLGDVLPKEFLLEITRNIQKDYPHIIFINEMWDIATQRENPQIFDGQTNSLMNYPLRDAIVRWIRWGNYEHFLYTVKKIYEEYPKTVSEILMNVVSTHDTVTLMTVMVSELVKQSGYIKLDDIEGPWRCNPFDTFGFRSYCANHDILPYQEKEIAIKRVKMALPIFYTFPGNPSMLQGTEDGIMGHKDPFCRKVINWYNPNTDMRAYIKSLNEYAEKNIDILGDCEPRTRKINEEILVLEVYSEKGEIVLLSNNATHSILNKDFNQGYRVVFNEKSTKDEIEANGTLILRRDK